VTEWKVTYRGVAYPCSQTAFAHRYRGTRRSSQSATTEFPLHRLRGLNYGRASFGIPPGRYPGADR
jgi:hypothetical protein